MTGPAQLPRLRTMDPLAASGPPGVDPQSSDSSEPESSGPSDSDEDLKDCWSTVLTSLKNKGRREAGGESARLERPLVCDDAPTHAPAIPAVVPPLARGPRAHQAPRGSRTIGQCGAATLSEVVSGGHIIGYGIVCGRHSNAKDRPDTQCKKQCLLGAGSRPISQSEAKLRLKRWFVTGQLQEAEWPAHSKREKHLTCGGQGLALLASDAAGWSEMSEDELNATCHLLPPAA